MRRSAPVLILASVLLLPLGLLAQGVVARFQSVLLGRASSETGAVTLYHASSASGTTIQPGNATAAVTYVLPTAGPSTNGMLNSTPAGVLSWVTAWDTASATPFRVLTNSFERLYIKDGAKALTDDTFTTIFTLNLGDDLHGGGTLGYCVAASDGSTTRQNNCGEINFTGIDVTAGAGGEACGAVVAGVTTSAVSVGTLTVTATATTGTDLCNIQVKADTSLAAPTTLEIRWYAPLHGNTSAVTITPL